MNPTSYTLLYNSTIMYPITVVPIDHISLYKHYIKHEHLSTSAAAPSGQPTGYQDVGDPPVYDKQMV